ncbi:MAG: deoxyguanosinetriphosphate triphosphohydrolase [Moraxella sp.]|nr:deoxyguanosinetriphosphate triphosphohydrolase [Moraxella sp.]
MNQDRWRELLSTNRFKIDGSKVVPAATASTSEGVDVLRTDFHIDYDRVVFSGAFRRLGRKTQVHPFAKHDHTHNRLTHSVEVASVGRSLGNHVGMRLQQGEFLPAGYTPSDIGTVVQVACLAHDLGNPPFGHTGEDALRAWFIDPKHAHLLDTLTDSERADICTYEGNAHSLRTLASLEMYTGRGGMRLTSASLGALLKYPWTATHPTARHKGKFNIYQTELPLIQAVADDLGLARLGDNHWARHPLSYLMEAADDICYALLDLEDAVELDLLGIHEFESVLQTLIPTEKTWRIDNPTERCSALRGMAIGRAIESVATIFIKHHTALVQGEFEPKDLLAVCDDDLQYTLATAKKLARDKVFRHHSKLATEIASFGCLGLMLDLFVPAVHALSTHAPLSTKNTLCLELMDNPVHKDDSLYIAYMKVLDFVGGMTDNRAASLARELSGVGML